MFHRSRRWLSKSRVSRLGLLFTLAILLLLFFFGGENKTEDKRTVQRWGDTRKASPSHKPPKVPEGGSQAGPKPPTTTGEKLTEIQLQNADRLEVYPPCREEVEYLYLPPNGVEEEHKWRYSAKGLYWNKCDETYKKFEKYNQTLELPPNSVKIEIDRVCKVLLSKNRRTLCEIFKKTYPNTLETTVKMLHDGTTFVITGDIPLMWLRDSAAQVNQYLPLAKEDPYLQIIIEGVIRRDIKWLKLDPYGSSYRMFLDFDFAGKTALTPWDYRCGRTAYVAQHDYEMDSQCYFIKLSYDYWKTTGINAIFDVEWKEAVERIIDTWLIEQEHNAKSSYRYPTLDQEKGTRTCDNKLLWVGMRPSDDKCQYHFLIPANMMAVVSLRQIAEILREFFPQEKELIATAEKMASEVDEAIHTHGVVKNLQIYAYEADGCGNTVTMDDANIPSLLSIPYLGYTSELDVGGVIAANTRKWVLSSNNKYFHSRGEFEGIGSPHTGAGSKVWPLSIIMRALTTDDPVEINKQINMLEKSTAGTNMMHESFDVANPSQFTRGWFAWANSLFSELILKKLDVIEPK